jgi:hypothetical protein
MQKDNKDRVFSNIKNSQFNFSHDNSILNASFTVNGVEVPEEKLKLAIKDFLKAIRNDTTIVVTDKQSIEAKAETIIEDIEDENLNLNRLSRFRNVINNIGPELLVGSTLAASVSGVKDAIELFVK